MSEYVSVPEKALKDIKEEITSLNDIEMGNKTIKETVIDNFDWFVLKDIANQVVVVPVWSLRWDRKINSCITRESIRYKNDNGHSILNCNSNILNTEIWVMPIFREENDNDKLLDFKSLSGVVYRVETNDYIKNFNIAKEFNNLGYDICGLYHGIEIEKKNPIVEQLSNSIIYDKKDKVQDVACKFAKYFAEQLKVKNNRLYKVNVEKSTQTRVV